MNREPVTTTEEIETFPSDEVLEGYMDGIAGDDEPGDNRSKAYWHGWRNGNNDRNQRVDGAQKALIRDMRAKGKLGVDRRQ